MLLITLYIICSYQIALRVWFADKIVESHFELVGFFQSCIHTYEILYYEKGHVGSEATCKITRVAEMPNLSICTLPQNQRFPVGQLQIILWPRSKD